MPRSKVVRGFSFFGVSFVYVIFEDGRSGLQNLVPGSIGLLRESKAIGSDDAAGVEDNFAAQRHVAVERDVGMQSTLLADHHVIGAAFRILGQEIQSVESGERGRAQK